MSRPRPPSQDCIRDIMGKIDLLVKKGLLPNDLPVNTAEASALTGLSQETLRRYGTLGHFPTFKYPHRNLYPCRELCEWTLKHYHGATVNTSQMNNYKPTREVKAGRPRKEKRV